MLLRELAGCSGLTRAWTAALLDTYKAVSTVHLPGAVLRDQAEVFGVVASDATAWRVVRWVDTAHLDRLRAARAAAWARV